MGLASETWLRAFWGLVVFSILGTLASRLTGLDPGWIAPIASALTMVCGVAALLASLQRVWPGRAVPLALAVLGVGAASEIVGLYSGLPFGRYTYTDRWWPAVPLPGGHHFPLLLPLAWALMAGGAYVACAPMGRWGAIVGGAVLATAIDLFMEPVMAGTLGYWRWLEPGPLPGGAPWLNPVGWLLTSLAAGLILSRGGKLDRRAVGVARSLLIAFVTLVAAIGIIDTIPVGYRGY